MPLADLPFREFLAQTAAKQPTPGGGAIAAAAGALAAALAEMVVSYSLGKKSLAPHQSLLEDAARRLSRAREMLLELADEDAAAYGLVNELSRLPEGDPRRRELPSAQEASVRVPMAMSAVGVETLRLLLELCGKSNHQLRSDLAIAAVLAEACTRGGQWNVLVNAPFLADARQRDAATHESRALTERAIALARDVERACHGAGGT